MAQNTNECAPVSVALPNGLTVECFCASEVAQLVEDLQGQGSVSVTAKGDALVLEVEGGTETEADGGN